MMKTYQFNKLVYGSTFEVEIQRSTIKVGLVGIATKGNVSEITFKAELSPEEYDVLQALVTLHDPTPPSPETDVLKTTDNRFIVKPNVRPLFTSGYFTARDDNRAIPKDVGGGNNYIKLHHKIGDPEVVTITQQFNVEGNRTWIHEGYMTHIGAEFDSFCFYISTKPTPTTPQAGTIFKQTSKGIIVPVTEGAGDVNIDTENLTTLVSVVPRTDNGTLPAAYWNATYNLTTGKYENLTPAPDGKGKYNIFFVEAILKRYINNICLIGNTHPKFETSDPSELGTNMLCNYRFTTNMNPDHEWKASIYVSMFREKIT